jgi:hypothetical protein
MGGFQEMGRTLGRRSRTRGCQGEGHELIELQTQVSYLAVIRLLGYWILLTPLPDNTLAPSKTAEAPGLTPGHH